MRKQPSHAIARALTVLVATVGLATSAAAQSSRGITLYSDIGFSGGSQTFRDDIPDLRAVGLNDSISSIVVPNGEVWQICEDINYQGRCQNVSGSMSDLRAGDWNDKISSMRLVSGGGFRNRRFGGANSPNGRYYDDRSGQLTYYNGPNFRGNSTVVTPGSNTSLPAERGSLRVTGGVWRLCDADGNCATVDRDVANMWDLGLTERIVSVRELNPSGSRRYPYER
jgi:hypothetical protein